MVASAAVFLDRDGVINRAIVRNGRPYPPDRVEEFELLPGVPEAVTALQEAGFMIVVATNQPDVATGRQARSVVEAMHDRLRAAVQVDDIRVCYHGDGDGCGCRKPKPGMLLAAAADHGIDLGRSVMVGDRWRDVGAGRAAGCYTILIDCGYDERVPEAPDAVASSLAGATGMILARQRAGSLVDQEAQAQR